VIKAEGEYWNNGGDETIWGYMYIYIYIYEGQEGKINPVQGFV
jgi:hypothetical protein